MKIGVAAPGRLVDITPPARLDRHRARPDGGARIGAWSRNAELAAHPAIAAALAGGRRGAAVRRIAAAAQHGDRRRQPAAAHALPLLPRPAGACNRRAPGTGCAALGGDDREHAMLGGSEPASPRIPSDLAVALVALDAVGRDRRGRRRRPPAALRRLASAARRHPERETALEHGELVTHFELPGLMIARALALFKIRDRSATSSPSPRPPSRWTCERGIIRDARIALGGVATRPWRCPAAEHALRGRRAELASFRAAAERRARRRRRRHPQRLQDRPRAPRAGARLDRTRRPARVTIPGVRQWRPRADASADPGVSFARREVRNSLRSSWMSMPRRYADPPPVEGPCWCTHR